MEIKTPWDDEIDKHLKESTGIDSVEMSVFSLAFAKAEAYRQGVTDERAQREDVIITVNSGVADVAQVPEGVKVIIRDYDGQEDGMGHGNRKIDDDMNYFDEITHVHEGGKVVII